MAEIQTPQGVMVGLLVQDGDAEKHEEKQEEAPTEKRRVGRPPKTEK